MNRFLSLFLISVFALSFTSLPAKAQSDADVSKQSFDMAEKNNESQDCHVAYKLYPTQNVWTFIKLDTRNGKMTRVQCGLKANKSSETTLNDSFLIDGEKEINGRFALYRTFNPYNFILLDRFNGNLWQVQWSAKPENRAVVPINKE